MAAWSCQGKTAWVVGGSMGIGLAAAKELARRGADVLVFARRPESLAQAVREIAGATAHPGQRVESRVLDVRDREQVDAVVSAGVTSFGAPDVLLNCAGRARPDHFERISTAQLRDTLELNLVGTWNAIQAVLPHMKARGSGDIVNTASIAGLIGIWGYTDYAASKFAVIGFSEALRGELRPLGIRVAVLCPPDTETPGLEEENRTKPAETRAIAAAARCLSAEAVAAALLAGLERGQFLIVPGAAARLTVLAARWAPGLVRWYLDRTVEKASRR